MTTTIASVNHTTGRQETMEITDDFALVLDGSCYLASHVFHANGTTVLTIKGRAAAPGPRRLGR